jgi:hypothetical protein
MQAPDSTPRRVVLALAGLLLLAGAAMAAALWLLHPPGTRSQSPAAFSSAAGAAELQTAPQPDLQRYRAQKNAELAATGPAADAQGFARIPVDRAMALMTERGLRAEAPQQAGAQAGVAP